MNDFQAGFVYLANPYTHSDPSIVELRYVQTEEYVAERLAAGEVIYSPICHHHHLAKHHKMPTDWPFWRHIDANMLTAAKRLRVLKLEGWEKSVGVQAEIAIAMTLKIPVEYANPKQDSSHDGSNARIPDRRNPRS